MTEERASPNKGRCLGMGPRVLSLVSEGKNEIQIGNFGREGKSGII